MLKCSINICVFCVKTSTSIFLLTVRSLNVLQNFLDHRDIKLMTDKQKLKPKLNRAYVKVDGKCLTQCW